MSFYSSYLTSNHEYFIKKDEAKYIYRNKKKGFLFLRGLKMLISLNLNILHLSFQYGFYSGSILRVTLSVIYIPLNWTPLGERFVCTKIDRSLYNVYYVIHLIIINTKPPEVSISLFYSSWKIEMSRASAYVCFVL